MKIIASTGNNKWLAEVDSFELSELNSEIKIEIGVEYEIRKAAETLSSLKGLSRTKMQHLKTQINELQKSYDRISSTYDEIMLIDTIKHSEKNE